MILPCGHNAENDGDRYYDDECMLCGWMTEARRQANKRSMENLKKMKERRIQHELELLLQQKEEQTQKETEAGLYAPTLTDDTLKETLTRKRG